MKKGRCCIFRKSEHTARTECERCESSRVPTVSASAKDKSAWWLRQGALRQRYPGLDHPSENKPVANAVLFSPLRPRPSEKQAALARLVFRNEDRLDSIFILWPRPRPPFIARDLPLPGGFPKRAREAGGAKKGR
jgi:hypothetical protein